jgi:GDP-mannose 6-dehydrogenase
LDHEKVPQAQVRGIVRIAIFGLGYVGVVSAACLARDGHDVLGIDPNSVKTELLNAGRSPIIESGLEPLIAAGIASGRLHASADARSAIQFAELLLLCVGTPGQPNGSLDLTFVSRVCEEIGDELAHAEGFKVVAVRSTMLPGSMSSIVIPTLEARSGKRAGADFGVCIHPEFLREGTAIQDYDRPPKIVIGSTDDRAASVLASLYPDPHAPVIQSDLATAELIKYADNAWHALKVAFANEMGRLAKAVDVDARALMTHFVLDTKLNISPAYLRPGFAFGGSCLPKDLRALVYRARSCDVNLPLLSAVLPSNRVQLDKALEMIQRHEKRRIGVLGLGFKEGTDDLRESPVVDLVERLLGKGYELKILDQHVRLASLMGANRDYIMNRIPHVGRLLVDDPDELVEHSEVVVLATAEPAFAGLVERLDRRHVLIDLVGRWDLTSLTSGGKIQGYDGIAW